MGNKYEETDVRTVEALDKIEAILREYDLFAAFIVASAERVHWKYHTTPSWSALSITEYQAHIKAKRGDFATAEQFKEVLTRTAGAIEGVRDFSAQTFTVFDKLDKMMKAQLGNENHYSDRRVKE